MDTTRRFLLIASQAPGSCFCGMAEKGFPDRENAADENYTKQDAFAVVLTEEAFLKQRPANA